MSDNQKALRKWGCGTDGEVAAVIIMNDDSPLTLPLSGMDS